MHDDAFPKTPTMQANWDKALAVLKPSKRDLEHGLALHRDSLVCDTFAFSPKVWTQRLVDEINAGIDEHIGRGAHMMRQTILRIFRGLEEPAGQEEFKAATRAAGVTCWVQTVGGEESMDMQLKNMAAHRHICHLLRGHLSQVCTAEEIRELKAQDRHGLVWSVNGPPPLVGVGGDLDERLGWYETWYHLGVRLMHLSYNRRNAVGDGCTEPANGGLSDFGYEVIRTMNRLGIIVDTPHSSKQTTLDAAAASSKPMMASHIGCRSVFDHPRCKTEEELKAIAETDGLIGIYGVPNLLGPGADLALLLKHLQAAAKVIGPRHVSIGTDLCYMRLWPDDLRAYPKAQEAGKKAAGWKPEHVAHATNEHLDGSLAWTNWPLFTVGLVQLGFGDDEIRQMLGQNLLRVLEANQPT